MVQLLKNRTVGSPNRDARPPLKLLPAYPSEREGLIRELALDRIRELHDDGVTADYVGRMYGVSADQIRDIEADLRRDRGHLPAPVEFG